MEGLESGKAAKAGDEGIAVIGCKHLHRGAQAMGGDGEAEFGQGGGVKGGAVTRQGVGVDGCEGKVEGVGNRRGGNHGCSFCWGQDTGVRGGVGRTGLRGGG